MRSYRWNNNQTDKHRAWSIELTEDKVEEEIDFKHINDTCEAYKKYLIAKWCHDKLPPELIYRI